MSLLEQERELTRVSELAERLNVSVRTVQRLFADHVGLSPSWVIRRYRLHEAAAHATAGGDVDWARLAVSLGYPDQGHLIRDFTATVGTAPARYAATASAPHILGGEPRPLGDGAGGDGDDRVSRPAPVPVGHALVP